MIDEPEAAATSPPTPKRFCKDCRWVQGAPPHDLPIAPLCMRPEAVYVEEDMVHGRSKTVRSTAQWFRRSIANQAGNVLACGPEARYFEPQEAT